MPCPAKNLMARELSFRQYNQFIKSAPGAKTIVCLGRWARFAHRRANVASEHKGLRVAMVVANVGAPLLRAEDATTRSRALNPISWKGSHC
jgi:hypothetical protein